MKTYAFTYSEYKEMQCLYERYFRVIFDKTLDVQQAGEQADIIFKFHYGLDHREWLDWYHSADWILEPGIEKARYDVSPDSFPPGLQDAKLAS